MRNLLDQRNWSNRKQKLGVRILDSENAERLDDHHLLCCWDDCEKYAVSLHVAREQASKRRGEQWRWYYFCSAGHLDYWTNSVRDLYNHSSGSRLTLL